jgi:acyl carrier protein
MGIEKVIIPVALLASSGSALAQDVTSDDTKHKDEVKALSKKEIYAKVSSITSNLLGISTENIKGDSEFTNDLGGDSLDLVTMIMECEKEFGVSISDEKAEKIKTVNHAVDLINNLLLEKTSARKEQQSAKKYDKVWDSSEGLARVRLNGKYGYIDKTGKEVVPCKYDNAFDFSKWIARVILNDKQFYIDKTGKCVKDCP